MNAFPAIEALRKLAEFLVYGAALFVIFFIFGSAASALALLFGVGAEAVLAVAKFVIPWAASGCLLLVITGWICDLRWSGCFERGDKRFIVRPLQSPRRKES